MASGQLSPRQKMINLMYLVFIAMLAMNMSKEVLSAFGYVNVKLNTNISMLEKQTNDRLSNLQTKADEQPDKYDSLFIKSKQVNKLSNDFSSYLDHLTEEFYSEVPEEERTVYELLDNSGFVDNYFFKSDKFTDKGLEFLSNIASYKDEMINIVNEVSNTSESKSIIKNIEDRFNTDDKVNGLSKQPWLNNRFYGFPLISSIVNITSMKSDVKVTSVEVINLILNDQLESDAGINNQTYQTIVIQNKPVFFSDENFTGKVVLGRIDAKLVPTEVTVNDALIPVTEGEALLDFPAGAIGEHEIKGRFVFTQNGENIPIPISEKYTVIARPNSAVISADKMNVVYRGVDNPMTISMPGISDDRINADANVSGLRKLGNGKYMVNIGRGTGKEISITVTGTTTDGTSISTPAKKFRIKNIPSPHGTIRKESGYVKMPKSNLGVSTVGVNLPDFDFELSLITTGFKLKVPGASTVVVSGNKMNAAAKKAIARARRGDVVTIFGIKSKLANSTILIGEASSISVEIQ